MIFRRYGSSVQSVDTHFASKALTEIGFRRNGRTSIPVADFEDRFQRVGGEELSAEADGPVQDETEQRLLDDLEAQLGDILDGLGEGEVLLVESAQGEDYPKTRTRQRNVIRDGENRLHFHVTVDPPLRLGVYREQT